MIIHLMKPKYTAYCGTMGAWSGTTIKNKVTCGRCLQKMGREVTKKLYLKQGLFLPRNPSKQGQNI